MDLGRFAGVGGNHLVVERNIAIQNMGVEQQAGVGAIFGVVIGSGFTLRTGAIELAIR